MIHKKEIDIELDIENAHAYLLDVQKYLNISSSFINPTSIKKISANFRYFETDTNPIPVSFSELDTYAKELYTKIGDAVLYDDVRLYIADKIWDKRLFSGKIIGAQWALLAALRITVRTLRGLSHEAFQGVKKALSLAGFTKDNDWIVDQIYQKLDKLAFSKYETLITLFTKNYPLLKGDDIEKNDQL